MTNRLVSRFLVCLVATVGWSAVTLVPAKADVFTLPHFVHPGDWAVGVQPEITLSNGAGLGTDIHFQYGLNDLSNVKVRLGTGASYRHFRYGVAGTLDFFPDIQGQPGIGIGAAADYVNLYTGGGQLELKAIPYIHKTLFVNTSGKGGQNDEIEPYLAVPVGVAFNSGTYSGLSQVVVGSFFKSSEHFRFNLEMGIAINNTTSFISGGVAYYY